MKTGILFLTFFAFIACSNSSSEVIDDKEQPKPGQLGQQVDGSLIADGNSAKTYDLIKRSGYDHEAPDSSREHKTEHFQHIQQVADASFFL